MHMVRHDDKISRPDPLTVKTQQGIMNDLSGFRLAQGTGSVATIQFQKELARLPPLKSLPLFGGDGLQSLIKTTWCIMAPGQRDLMRMQPRFVFRSPLF